MSLFGRKKTTANSPVVAPAPPPAETCSPPAMAPDPLLDRALDTLAAVVRTLGRYAFDLASVDKETVTRRCEAWARNVLTGAPLETPRDTDDEQQTGSRPRVAVRDFRGLQQFMLEHRRDEQRFVVARLGELKETIWQFVEGLRGIAGEGRASEVSIRTSLTQLESAVKTDSIETIRALVPRTIDAIHQTLEERRARFEQHLSHLGSHLRALRADLLDARRRLELDPLTQLYNRGAFDGSLRSYVDLCLFAGQPLVLIMLDLDHFKAVNDTHGHPVGDRVLVEVARCIQRVFPRKTDLVARYGGEEFVVLLPDASAADGARLAERLLQAVRKLRVPLESEQTVTLTCSAGLSELEPEDTAERLLARADAALYRAKSAGRDRVEVKSTLEA